MTILPSKEHAPIYMLQAAIVMYNYYYLIFKDDEAGNVGEVRSSAHSLRMRGALGLVLLALTSTVVTGNAIRQPLCAGWGGVGLTLV